MKLDELWSTIDGMQGEDRIGRDYFRRIDPQRVENQTDVELAYQLQNSTRGNPDLLKALIDSYASDLYRWARALLYYKHGTEPGHEEIMAILRSVYARAVTHTEQFGGQASAIAWLFGICYQVIRSSALPDWIVLHIYKNPTKKTPEESAGVPWRLAEKFPEKLRTPILLRYLFHWDVDAIASVFSIQARDIHSRLVAGRKRFMRKKEVPHMDSQIQAYVDGLLDDHPDEMNQLAEHIETCGECLLSLRAINEIETSLSGSLNDQWNTPLLNQQELDSLAKTVLLTIQQTKVNWKPAFNLRQVSWILGITAVFIGLAVMFIRMTPVEREFPQAQVTPTAQLPPVINMQPLQVSSSYSSLGSEPPQFIIPAFSSDAEWAVFTEIRSDPSIVSGVQPTIKLFNRADDIIQVISQNPGTIRLPWAYWVLAPSISGDGQRVVYVTATNDPKVDGLACVTANLQPCLDIFLYDRQTGLTKRLSQSWNAGAANGSSLVPTISADGQWVAFWSQADNLVAGNPTICPQDKIGSSCLYIYLYNIQTYKMERVPQVVINDGMVPGVDRISLSADGRYVGFTLTPAAQVGDSLTGHQASSELPGELTNRPLVSGNMRETEAVVYDQQTSKFEFENQAPGGTPGNGASSSPVLSADGSYVAFTSASSNLVGGDYNQSSDVFVRDRSSGAVELVSVTSNGTQGNDNSGLTYWTNAVYSINMSGDGRYIIFESAANNLAPEDNYGCSGWGVNVCNHLYIHDRQTGQTAIVTALPNQDYSFFPGISFDGRWLAFMQPDYQCGPALQLCSNVMMYDTQRGWLANLSQFGIYSYSLPWSSITSLKLPSPIQENQVLAVSPDGKIVASGGNDSKIWLWNIGDSATPINHASPDRTIDTNSKDDFTSIAISNNSDMLAAGTTTGTVYIWNLPEKRLLYTLKNQVDSIKKIIFTQDGAHIIISSNSEVLIWSVNGNQLILDNQISTGPNPTFALDTTAKGDLLATGRGDGTIWLQSLPSGKVIARLGGFNLAVYTLAFSQDGTLLAARSGSRINLWKIVTNDPSAPSFELLNSITSYDYSMDLAFSPDDKYLATGGEIGNLTLWSVPDAGQYNLSPLLPTASGMVYGVAFAQSGNVIAAIFEHQIIIWGIPKSQVSQYFTLSSSDKFVDSGPLPQSTASDSLEYFNLNAEDVSRELDVVDDQLPFPLIVPTHLPESIDFEAAMILRDRSVLLMYSACKEKTYDSLFIFEKVIGGSTPPTMTIGASAQLISTQLETAAGEYVAEFVRGDWLSMQSITAPQGDELKGIKHEVWQWDNTIASQRLRWRQNGILVAFYYQTYQPYQAVLSAQGLSDRSTSPSCLLGQEDLMQIARSMRFYMEVKNSFTGYVPGPVSLQN